MSVTQNVSERLSSSVFSANTHLRNHEITDTQKKFGEFWLGQMENRCDICRYGWREGIMFAPRSHQGTQKCIFDRGQQYPSTNMKLRNGHSIW